MISSEPSRTRSHLREWNAKLVTEALLAAKISRNLERPQFETDGRFARAIRLARQHGTYRQQLEAQYEQIWTRFWWFDDVRFFNESYGDFEGWVLQSRHSKALQLLGNLHQLLVNCVVHRHLTREDCLYEERTARLKEALEAEASADAGRNRSWTIAALDRRYGGAAKSAAARGRPCLRASSCRRARS
jgi:hypothetical protein